jgi:hypothetical protein
MSPISSTAISTILHVEIGLRWDSSMQDNSVHIRSHCDRWMESIGVNRMGADYRIPYQNQTKNGLLLIREEDTDVQLHTFDAHDAGVAEWLPLVQAHVVQHMYARCSATNDMEMFHTIIPRCLVQMKYRQTVTTSDRWVAGGLQGRERIIDKKRGDREASTRCTTFKRKPRPEKHPIDQRIQTRDVPIDEANVEQISFFMNNVRAKNHLPLSRPSLGLQTEDCMKWSATVKGNAPWKTGPYHRPISMLGLALYCGSDRNTFQLKIIIFDHFTIGQLLNKARMDLFYFN